jgi:hypothetical protein
MKKGEEGKKKTKTVCGPFYTTLDKKLLCLVFFETLGKKVPCHQSESLQTRSPIGSLSS